MFSGQQIFFSPNPAITVKHLSVSNAQAFDQPVLAYDDAGENPLVIITADSQSASQPINFVEVTVTEYLVDCGIGHRAATAN